MSWVLPGGVWVARFLARHGGRGVPAELGRFDLPWRVWKCAAGGGRVRRIAVAMVCAMSSSQFETKTVKLDMGLRHGQRKLEQLLAEGWEVVDKREKGLLEFGTKTTFVLRRER